MTRQCLTLLQVLALSLLFSIGAAHAVPDLTTPSDAAAVLLRKDCGNPPVRNCLEDSAAPFATGFGGLLNWINTVRKPDASNPLVVAIGAGQFLNKTPPGAILSAFFCNAEVRGYTTFLGAGVGVTTIYADTSTSFDAALTVVGSFTSGGCEKLSFHDMTFQGRVYGVVWYRGGTSEWVNVELTPTVDGYGWYEDPPSCGATPGEHIFYGSRVVAPNPGVTGIAYVAGCDENIYYGGEIQALGTAQTGSNADLIGVLTWGAGSVTTYGTKIEAFSDLATTGGFDGAVADAVTAVLVGVDTGGVAVPGGSFEDYGGEIIANANTTSTESAIGLDVRQGGVIEMTGSSVNVEPGSTGGSATAISSAGSRIDGVSAEPLLVMPAPAP